MFEPSAQASAGPRVLVALDYNSTIGEPGTKDRLYDALGIDKAEFKKFAYDLVLRRIGRSQRPQRRAVKIEALVRWFEITHQEPLHKDEIAQFATNERPYDGMEETLRELRDHMRVDRNIEVVYAVITNAWEDMINNMSFCKGDDPLVQLVYGQRLHFDKKGVLLGPAGETTSHESKPRALKDARRVAGIPSAQLTIYVGNGYSDEPAWFANRRNGGMNLGLHEEDVSKANHFGHQDYEQMTRLSYETVHVPFTVELPSVANNHGRPWILDEPLLRDWQGLELSHKLETMVDNRAELAYESINLAAIRAEKLGISFGELGVALDGPLL